MKSTFKKMDKTLFFLMIAFTILGLVMIFSASSITAVLYNGLEESYYFKKHIYIIIVSWIFGLIILKQPIKKYKLLGPVGILIIMFLLAGLIPYGTITNSARSWYDLGFFSLQPSEFAKSIIIVYLAVALEKIYQKKDFTINKLITPFVFVLIILIFTAIQPDLGTAAVIGGIAFFIFMSLPFNDPKVKKLKIFGIISVIIVSLFILFGDRVLNAEQSSRLTFKEPCTRYTDKTGYQVCNGFIAINNGGLFGTGLGNSTQKYLYLPEAYTDFVFPIIVEELGAMLSIFIILAFIVLLYRILKIVKHANTLSGSIMAYGSFIFILLHLLINLLGILAIIPLTGIPVPFLSYGGSFYINIIFVLFLTQRVHIETYEAKKAKILKG